MIKDNAMTKKLFNIRHVILLLLSQLIFIPVATAALHWSTAVARPPRASSTRARQTAPPLPRVLFYDGIGHLVSVTDSEVNVTESTYDYGDSRTKVVHPANRLY